MCEFFFILTHYSFPPLPVKDTMLQLCFNYTYLVRIEHPLIWYYLFLHRIGIDGEITDLISVKFLFLFSIIILVLLRTHCHYRQHKVHNPDEMQHDVASHLSIT